MSHIREKVIIPTNLIEDIIDILKENSERLKKFKKLIKRTIFSRFYLNISFYGEFLMNMHGEDYYGLKMTIEIKDSDNIKIVFQDEKTIDKIEDIFEILYFEFEKKSYLISIEELYNNVSSYNRKKMFYIQE